MTSDPCIFDSPSGRRPSGRLLLVDDDDGLRSCLADALRDRGFETIEADRGLKALELGSSLTPALTLMDMNMPDMTGVEVYRRWRSAGLRFPVIFMTAEAEVELRLEAVRLGAVQVVSKPFSVHNLFDLVYRTLRECA